MLNEMKMEYETLISIYRKGKQICIFLKEGEAMDYENIVDVVVTPVECIYDVKDRADEW